LNAAPQLSTTPTIEVTLWTSRTSKVGTPAAWTWDELAAKLASPIVRPKEKLPGWSAASFEGHRRAKACARRVSALVLDLDEGAIPLERLCDVFAKRKTVVHSTASSTPSSPRWRVVVALSRDLSPEEYSRVWRASEARLREVGIELDTQARDPSRLWFMPSPPAEGAFVFHRIDGEPLEVDELLVANSPPSRVETLPAKRSRYGDAALASAAQRVSTAPGGKRNSTLNKEAFSMGRLVAGGVIERTRVESALLDAAARAGLGEAESRATFESGFGDGLQQPRTAPAPAQPTRPPAADAVTIVVDTDEMRVNDESVAALARRPGLFQRGGRLVELVDVDGRRVIRELPLARVRELLADSAAYVKIRDDEYGQEVQVPTHVPDWCIKAVASRGEWTGIPRLVGLLEAPAMRPDGTVIQEPGLDATGYLLMPREAFPRVADAPTRDDALRARDELLEVVRDFPFATRAHLAAWLAFALTSFARPAFEGTSPLFGVDATTRGTGKGRLVDATANLALGHDATKAGQPKDDDEMRKRITSVLREGDAIHVIDNVSRRIEDAALDACVTATVWKDRALGKNETFALPNLTLWVVTGNNLEFGADTARRTLHIRLESPLENPEDRDDFLHPDLLAWVRRERPRLVAAALTVLRAYYVAGCPDVGCKPWGSFEGWSRLIAHAVVWVGLPDPQTTRTELEDVADTRKGALAALLLGWRDLQAGHPEGLTVKRALELLYPAPTSLDRWGELREAIESLAPLAPGGKAPSAAKLGYHLRHFRRRVVGGRMFDAAAGHGGVLRWRVVLAVAGGDGGDGGDDLVSPRGEFRARAHAHARDRACDVSKTSPPSPPSPPPDGVQVVDVSSEQPHEERALDDLESYGGAS
jgi:hypothetical protein